MFDSNKSIPAVFLTLGLITGYLFFAQLKSQKSENYDPYKPFLKLEKSIDVLTLEQKYLQEDIFAKREKIDELQKIISKDKTRLAYMEELKKEIGLTEVNGLGVRITIDDSSELLPENVEKHQYCYAADLRDVLNILRKGNSAAIAINGQRIISLTAINCLGNSVLIDNTRMLPPFQIMALNDNPDNVKIDLETIKFLPNLNRMKEENEIIFDIESSKEIVIPPYKGKISTNYLK